MWFSQYCMMEKAKGKDIWQPTDKVSCVLGGCRFRYLTDTQTKNNLFLCSGLINWTASPSQNLVKLVYLQGSNQLKCAIRNLLMIPERSQGSSHHPRHLRWSHHPRHPGSNLHQRPNQYVDQAIYCLDWLCGPLLSVPLISLVIVNWEISFFLHSSWTLLIPLSYVWLSTGSICGYGGGFPCQLCWTMSLELPVWSDLLEVLEAVPFHLYIYIMTSSLIRYQAIHLVPQNKGPEAQPTASSGKEPQMPEKIPIIQQGNCNGISAYQKVNQYTV